MRKKKMKKLDAFLTNTRVFSCTNVRCKFHDFNSPACNGDFSCTLKEIELDEHGRCASMEIRKDTIGDFLNFFKSKGVTVRE